MNTRMYLHPAVAGNIETLKSRGCHFIGPEEGDLACGWQGKGRLADVERIIDRVDRLCCQSAVLSGKRVCVTAGRTEEPLDPVRFLTNPSTGKMGYALAGSARARGADVSLVSGPTHLSPPVGVEVTYVRTADEMARRVTECYEQCDILLMAAAVADYRPQSVASRKMKKADANLILTLERTPDILAELGQRKADALHIGFAAETDGGIEKAREKLVTKNLDMIVLNDITAEGAGFGSDTNIVTLIDGSDKDEQLPMMSKNDVAERIMDRVVAMLDGR